MTLIDDPLDGIRGRLRRTSTPGAGWWSIGNGMAGARTVEEILARGGADSSASPCSATSRTATTTASCSPTCCPAKRTTTDIFLNCLRLVRRERHHAARRGPGRPGSTGSPSWSTPTTARSTPYDVLIIATGSRSFMPADRGPAHRRRRAAAGRLRVPHHRRHPRRWSTTRSTTTTAGGRDRRRAARPGGRPRAAGATACRSTCVHAGPHLMNAQIGRRRRGRSCGKSVEDARHRRCTPRPAPPRSWARTRSRGVWLLDGSRLLECDMVVVAAGIRPNVDLAVTSGFTVERAIVVDDQMRTIDDPDVFAVGECVQHRGEVYGLVAPLWEQAVVLADQRHRRRPGAAYHGSRTATKLKVAGVDVAVDGRAGPGAGHRRAHRRSPSRSRGRLQVAGDPRRQAHRRDAARRQLARSRS